MSLSALYHLTQRGHCSIQKRIIGEKRKKEKVGEDVIARCKSSSVDEHPPSLLIECNIAVEEEEEVEHNPC